MDVCGSDGRLLCFMAIFCGFPLLKKKKKSCGGLWVFMVAGCSFEWLW